MVGWIQIQADDVSDFLDEEGIIGQLEGLRHVRLDPEQREPALHRTLGHAFGLGHQTDTPVLGVGRLVLQGPVEQTRDLLGWKGLGYARRFNAEIVNYAADFVVLGRVPAAIMRAAVEDLMKRLKLTLNAEKTREVRVPEEPLEFLGYRIGRNYLRDTGRAYIGTRPSPESVQSICRRVRELTARRHGLLEPEQVVERLNRLLRGWANYFYLGQVSPAYTAIDRHATRRLRRWLCCKHKVRTGKKMHFPDERLWEEWGLTRLISRTASFPWAKA